MRVGFHSNCISLRGTEVALYDYADFNESLLGNESVIFTPHHSPVHHQKVFPKFFNRFPVSMYDTREELADLVQRLGIDVMYFIKQGDNDGLLVPGCKNVVHAVFQYYEPHGHAYAYISEWLSNVVSKGQVPFVPHMVRPPQDLSSHLRQELGIPEDATVFGRHGGSDTFDIDGVQTVVQRVAQEAPNTYFIFMNTNRFCEPRRNVIFLEGTSDPVLKQRFINTADCMLHARAAGETFGLAVAEFSVSNKPVLTWSKSRERAHLDILGDKALLYHGGPDLFEQLLSFDRSQQRNWDAYSEHFSPEPVMKKFAEVFL
jgi:hypothetical protein